MVALPFAPGDPIGLFDSGEGGLTVARELARRLPGERLIYACDTARFPYGPRSLTDVRRFVRGFMRFFTEYRCKLVVLACNTATVASLDLLESGFPMPVMGVVGPGARAAAEVSRSGRIGVAATQGTCASGIYPQFIQRARPDAVVVQEACPILVIRAEEGVISGPEVRTEVERCLRPLVQGAMDTLVLGCTHFPHMQSVIKDVVGPSVALVDPGVATAAEVEGWLVQRGLKNPSAQGSRTFFTTGDPARFVHVAGRLWPGGVPGAQQITISMDQE